MKRWPLLVLCAIVALIFSGCAFMTRGRCYIEQDRYSRMRTLFTATNSLQQVEQAMTTEGWSDCEQNEFRYRINKDLTLDPAPEPDPPGAEILP